MSTLTPLISTKGLTKSYGPIRALNDLNMDLYGGQVVALLGENGCGKTTLFKILAGVCQVYEGDAQIAGHRPGPESKAKVSYLPDASFLPNSAKASACIKLYRDFFADFNADKALDSIQFFGLDPNMRLQDMSKGMREKVQISLAMARNASVYLLDEPISGVDPAARQLILDGILRNFSPDGLLVIATHLIHDLEPIVDSVVLMRYGQVLLSGNADDLRTEHQTSLDGIFRKVYR